jgi:hypothetical protein
MPHMGRFPFVASWLMFPRLVMAQTMKGGEESSSRKTEHRRASLQAVQAAIDDDLLEVTIPQLEKFYASRKYTVTQVVEWHLARIAKYNGIYRAVQTLDARGALATAAAEDAAAAKSGSSLQRGPLWGVPMPRDCSLRANAVIGFKWPDKSMLTKTIFIVAS